MIIEPKEFLERTCRLGAERRLYKGLMVVITDQSDSIDQAISKGLLYYFGYTTTPLQIRCILAFERDLPLTEDETYTDAFKLLRILAD